MGSPHKKRIFCFASGNAGFGSKSLQSGLTSAHLPCWTSVSADHSFANPFNQTRAFLDFHWIVVEYDFQAAFRRQMCHRSWFGLVTRLLLTRWRRLLHTDVMLRDADETDEEAIERTLFDFAVAPRPR